MFPSIVHPSGAAGSGIPSLEFIKTRLNNHGSFPNYQWLLEEITSQVPSNYLRLGIYRIRLCVTELFVPSSLNSGICPWIPQEVAQCLCRGRGLGSKRGALLDPLQGDLGRWGWAGSLGFFSEETTWCISVYKYMIMNLGINYCLNMHVYMYCITDGCFLFFCIQRWGHKDEITTDVD